MENIHWIHVSDLQKTYANNERNLKNKNYKIVCANPSNT